MKNKIGKAVLLFMGALMLIGALIYGSEAVSKWTAGKNTGEALSAFDPMYDNGIKEYVEFDMITYPFAGFELNDTQGFYFVFDDMLPYIVCMEDARLEGEFQAIYDYTFSDSMLPPERGCLEGYAVEIDDELKALAIDEFNYIWNEKIVNEENFTDYFGKYYLDTIYVPDEGESIPEMLGMTVLMAAMGIFFLYCAFAKKKTAAHADAAELMQEELPERTEEALEEGPTTAKTLTAGELPVQGNLIVAVLAAFIGATAGGVLWIVLYKLGYVAAVTGFVGAYGAIWCWTKVGKRELTVPAMVWCILAAAAMLVLGNYIVYAWEITDVLNASNPGRAEFVKVLQNMPQIMAEWKLWSSFAADMVIALVLAAVSGAVELFRKKNRA